MGHPVDRSTTCPYQDGELGAFYFSRYDHPVGVEIEQTSRPQEM